MHIPRSHRLSEGLNGRGQCISVLRDTFPRSSLAVSAAWVCSQGHMYTRSSLDRCSPHEGRGAPPSVPTLPRRAWSTGQASQLRHEAPCGQPDVVGSTNGWVGVGGERHINAEIATESLVLTHAVLDVPARITHDPYAIVDIVTGMVGVAVYPQRHR